MNQKLLKELNINDKFEGYLLVKSSEQRMTKDNKSFVDMNVADMSTEINAKNWNVTAIAPEVGEIIKVSGQLIDYRGTRQLKIENMSVLPTEEKNSLNLSFLIKSAPYNAQDMLNRIYKVVDDMHVQDLKLICKTFLDKYSSMLLYYPAAKEMHHAEKSGLLHHIFTMLHASMALKEVYTWLNWDLVNAGIILHDICKIVEMNSNNMGIVDDYTKDGILVGHLIRGVAEIQRVADELNISGEVVLLLQHMLLSHHGIPEYGSPKRPMFAEALILHYIDDIDAKLYQFKAELENIDSGSFSGYIKSLERRIYKPLYEDLK